MDNNRLINQTKYMMGLFSFLGIFMIFAIIFTNYTPKGTYSVNDYYLCCRNNDDYCWNATSDDCTGKNPNCTCKTYTPPDDSKPKTATFKDAYGGGGSRTCYATSESNACSIITPSGGTRSGYTFIGWSTSSACTTIISAGVSVPINSDEKFESCYSEIPKEILVTFRCDNGPDLDADGQGRNNVVPNDDNGTNQRDAITGPIIEQQKCTINTKTGKCKAGDIKAPSGFSNWWYLKTSCATTPDATSSWIDTHEFSGASSVVFFTCCTGSTVTRSCYECDVNGQKAMAFATSTTEAVKNTGGTNCKAVENNKCTLTTSCYACDVNGTTDYKYATSAEEAAKNTGGKNCSAVENDKCEPSPEEPVTSCYACDVNGTTDYEYATSAEEAAKNTGGKNCNAVDNDKCEPSSEEPEKPVTSCYECTTSTGNKYVFSTSSDKAKTATKGNNCIVVDDNKCKPTSTTNCYECDANGKKKHEMAKSVEEAEKITKGTSCSIVTTDKCNVTVNPKTGTLAIIIAWVVGICTLSYAIWFFTKNNKINNK